MLEFLPSTVNILRLNVDLYPKQQSLTVEQTGRHTVVRVDGVPLLASDTVPSVVWFRRLGAPGTAEHLDERFKQFSVGEANHTLESALSLLQPAAWINEYWSCRRASLKPVQQRAAVQSGFLIADSLISNAPIDAHEWIARRSSVVSKTLSTPVVFDDGTHRGFSFTHILDEVDRTDLESVALAPTQFQELVEPAYELRVTSIGERHFAVRIDADMLSSEGVRDWRSERITTSYSWHELPSGVDSRLSQLLARLELDYAATDFIVTPSGHYYFLESNPHGAWLWLEDELGDRRVSQAIAEHILARTRNDA